MAFGRLDFAFAALVLAAGVFACGSDTTSESREEIEPTPDSTDKRTGDDDDDDESGDPSLPAGAIPIPAEPQRLNGDPDEGYRALVNEPFISIGIPWSGFRFAMTDLESRDSLPGRKGNNALVNYGWNVGKKANGMEIASMNCLNCHAGRVQGKLIVGLGRPQHALNVSSGMAVNPALITAGLTTVAEGLEYQNYGVRLATATQAGPLIAFGAQAAHRDAKTLAWGASSQFDASTGLAGWVDVPPWWRTKKKNGLYANGMGRGDHVRHMMNMTIFSVADVEEIKRLDTMFVNIAAYLRSIEPPKFPKKTDVKLVKAGEQVFNGICASCHGTYGDDASYPNLLIPVKNVGTDPDLAVKGWVNAAAEDWWADSWYGNGGGKKSRYERHPAYVAPPLDGIWATAPFFHNGSVPTLEAVLDSKKRPSVWTSSFDDDAYDLDKVGWKAGQGETYDTTQPGLSNKGHTYADKLDADDRRALLEYLKTL